VRIYGTLVPVECQMQSHAVTEYDLVRDIRILEKWAIPPNPSYNSNLLEGSYCYLIGAIQNSPDQGMNWRKTLIEQSSKRGLDIKFLDPTNKVTSLIKEVGEERKKINTLKELKKWNDLSLMMKTIVRQDHRCVDLSDFVIFYLDSRIHTCGSYFEFQSALTQKKPYFIISYGGKKNVPDWLFGICDHECIYEEPLEVVEQLVSLNSGEIALSDRWVLFRKQIKEL
jgi:hypothetical protein